jgi:hypothetical protein
VAADRRRGDEDRSGRDDRGYHTGQAPRTEPAMTSPHRDPGTCRWLARLASPIDLRPAPRPVLFVGAALARGWWTVTILTWAAGLSVPSRIVLGFVAIAAGSIVANARLRSGRFGGRPSHGQSGRVDGPSTSAADLTAGGDRDVAEDRILARFPKSSHEVGIRDYGSGAVGSTRSPFGLGSPRRRLANRDGPAQSAKTAVGGSGYTIVRIVRIPRDDPRPV